MDSGRGIPAAPPLHGFLLFPVAGQPRGLHRLAHLAVGRLRAAAILPGILFPAGPALRIDHLYATRHFTPVRCRAVTTRHSDHRMVVADFLTDLIRKPY